MAKPKIELQGEAPSRSAVLAAFAAIYVIWGSTYLAIRFAIETLPPFLMAGTRFLVAGVLLYAWCRLRGAKRPDPLHWKGAALPSLFMLLGGVGAVSWAEQLVPSGLAALIVATVPLWLTVLAWLGPDGRRPGFREAAGIVLGLIGVAVLVVPGSVLKGEFSIDPVGAAVLVLASISWAFGSLKNKSTPGPDSHLFGVALLMVTGGLWLYAAGLVTGELGALSLESVSLRSVLSLLYLIVFGSILAFTAYVWLLDVAAPAQVGTYAFVNPVVAVFLGWLLADEPVTSRILVAAAIIVVGVALIVGGRPRSNRRDADQFVRDLRRRRLPSTSLEPTRTRSSRGREFGRSLSTLPEEKPQCSHASGMDERRSTRETSTWRSCESVRPPTTAPRPETWEP